ncbi:gamma-aminobutyric acid receptor subunit beta-1-like [Glandiceps talaboti]
MYLQFIYSLTMTATCNMDLRHYPFDEQVCGFELGTYGYNREEVKLSWYTQNGYAPIVIDPQVDLPQFDLKDWLTGSRQQAFYDIGEVDFLNATFDLEREIAFHVLDSFIPSGCLAVLASFTLWMPPTSPPARVTMGITCMLTLITKSALVRGEIPKVTYVTAIDIWYIFLELLVFFVLAEFAFVYYFYLKGELYARQQENKMTVDEKSKRPAVFSIGDIQKVKKRKEQELDNREHLVGCATGSIKMAWMKNVRERKITQEENYYRWLSEEIDKISRVVYLSAFVLFVLVYWSYYYHL